MALGWQEVSLPEGSPELPELFVCRPDPELSPPEAALALTEAVLTALQENLGKEGEQALTFLTEGAIAAGEGESADPAAAAAWGLIRSAQSEHPGRFALIDSDGSQASEQALPGALALAAEEPQLVLREGVALAGRVGSAQGDGRPLLLPAGPWRLDSFEPRLPGEPRAALQSATPPSRLAQPRCGCACTPPGSTSATSSIALGLYPGEAAIGGEGAGVVEEVGSEVE